MAKPKKRKVSFEEYQKVAKDLSDKYPGWKRIFEYEQQRQEKEQNGKKEKEKNQKKKKYIICK